MQKFTTIIFWISVLLLILWVGVPFVADMSDLVLTDKLLSDLYHSTRYIVVPGAFLLTLFKTLKKGAALYINSRTILLTTGAAFLSVSIFMAGFFDNLCGSTTKSTLFINRQVPSSKIFLKHYDCGAASAGFQQQVVRVDTVSGIFIRVRNVDTTKLDSDSWIRQPN